MTYFHKSQKNQVIFIFTILYCEKSLTENQQDLLFIYLFYPKKQPSSLCMRLYLKCFILVSFTFVIFCNMARKVIQFQPSSLLSSSYCTLSVIIIIVIEKLESYGLVRVLPLSHT